MTFWICVGRVERVGARPREDAERHGRAAVEIAVGDVVAGAELDARHVLQLHQAPAVRRLDDDVAELARIARSGRPVVTVYWNALSPGAGGAPIEPPETWTFCSRSACTTSPAVMP